MSCSTRSSLQKVTQEQNDELLASNHGMKIMTETQLEQVAKTITEVAAIPPLEGLKEDVFSIHQEIFLAKLYTAKGAEFDSHADEHHAICHPDTRVGLLHQIDNWAGDPDSERIFWLNGMAGTGKSTISRTVAQKFADKGELGASFFYKRGEWSRSVVFHNNHCSARSQATFLSAVCPRCDQGQPGYF